MNHFRDDLPLKSKSPQRVIIGNEATIDAGNRVRVSQLTTLLDVKQRNELNPLYWSTATQGAGSVTYVKSNGGSTLSVNGDSQYAIMQTKMFAPYFSGKGQFGEITFDNFNPDDNVIKRAGYFHNFGTIDDETQYDGIWVESGNGTIKFRINKGITSESILDVDQADWNLNTFSGRNFDNFTVFVFQFLYLGGTAVRLGFIDNGEIVWAHVYVHSGLVGSTFITYPEQPVRYEIKSTGPLLGGSKTFNAICAQVASEGSIDEVGVRRSFRSTDFQADLAGTKYATMGIRLKTTHKNVRVDLKNIDLMVETNDKMLWEVLLNPTVAGTFTYNDVANSALQFALGVTANTVTPDSESLRIASGNVATSAASDRELDSAIRMGVDLAGVADTVVVCITPLGNTLDGYANLDVQEYI